MESRPESTSARPTTQCTDTKHNAVPPIDSQETPMKKKSTSYENIPDCPKPPTVRHSHIQIQKCPAYGVAGSDIDVYDDVYSSEVASARPTAQCTDTKHNAMSPIDSPETPMKKKSTSNENIPDCPKPPTVRHSHIQIPECPTYGVARSNIDVYDDVYSSEVAFAIHTCY